MGRRMQHPEAVRARLYDESRRPNPWTPSISYRIVLFRKDGTREYVAAQEPTLEAAREEIRRRFEFDVDNRYEKAWIREVVRCL